MKTIIQGDCRDVLMDLPDNSVDCIVTSPPYWMQRDYQVSGQIGMEPTYQEYITTLISVFMEAKRVLKSTGTCFVVIGDVYSGDKRGKTDRAYSNADMVQQQQSLHKKVLDIPRKGLLQLPARFSIAMTDEGWILRNHIIWQKPRAMPSSAKDRFTIDFEDAFFFTKSSNYHFNTQYEPMRTKDKNPPRGSLATPGNLNAGRRKQPTSKTQFYPDNWMRIKRCVWSVNPENGVTGHYAMFPRELIKTMILAGSDRGGVVLDPFSGSGTTGIVCKELDRDYIGIELNQDYVEIQNRRISNTLVQEKLF